MNADSPGWMGGKMGATPLYWQFNFSMGDPEIALRHGDWKLLATLRKFSLYNLRARIGADFFNHSRLARGPITIDGASGPTVFVPMFSEIRDIKQSKASGGAEVITVT